MTSGLDLQTLLLVILGVLLLIVIVDLFLAGGAMSTGMMAGMAGMGTPWGHGLFLVLVVLVLVALFTSKPG